MPRTNCCRDPDLEMREQLFGITCISELAKRTGITEQTLSRRKKSPRDLRYGELIAICKAQGMKVIITKPDFDLTKGR